MKFGKFPLKIVKIQNKKKKKIIIKIINKIINKYNNNKNQTKSQYNPTIIN